MLHKFSVQCSIPGTIHRRAHFHYHTRYRLVLYYNFRMQEASTLLLSPLRSHHSAAALPFVPLYQLCLSRLQLFPKNVCVARYLGLFFLCMRNSIYIYSGSILYKEISWKSNEWNETLQKDLFGEKREITNTYTYMEVKYSFWYFCIISSLAFIHVNKNFESLKIRNKVLRVNTNVGTSFHRILLALLESMHRFSIQPNFFFSELNKTGNFSGLRNSSVKNSSVV